jgi:2-haloalkanoic acid dehalogenase type II
LKLSLAIKKTSLAIVGCGIVNASLEDSYLTGVEMHTLVFDVYGTLVDTTDIITLLEVKLGERAAFFAKQWWNKQLEYSYRMGLMRWYKPFSQCMRYAFEYTCEEFCVSFTDEEKEALFLRNLSLPAFDDVTTAMPKFALTDADCFAFSNGTVADVNAVLTYAAIRPYLQNVISVDPIKMFKPSRIAYMYLVESIAHHKAGFENSDVGRKQENRMAGTPQTLDLNVPERDCLHYVESGIDDVDESDTHSQGDSSSLSLRGLNTIWLISSNPFDVIGAKVAGLQAVWIRRSASSVFDPWGVEPTITVANLTELYDVLRYRNVVIPM